MDGVSRRGPNTGQDTEHRQLVFLLKTWTPGYPPKRWGRSNRCPAPPAKPTASVNPAVPPPGNVQRLQAFSRERSATLTGNVVKRSREREVERGEKEKGEELVRIL